jgi:hypothetical protein
MMTTKTEYFCSNCGGVDLEITTWLHLNTDRVTGDEGPLDAAFCPDCEEHDKRWEERQVPVDTAYPNAPKAI